MNRLTCLLLTSLLATICAGADTVWLDEAGIWDLLPKDLGIACWTGNCESALRFATEKGHKTFIAGYYGRKTMEADRKWVRLAKSIPGCDCRGMMYTQWGEGFAQLREFADAVRDEERSCP